MKLQRPQLRNVTIAVSLAILPQILHAQDVCEAFAKYGLYDTRIATSSTERESSFRHWFCQSKFESRESADAAGLSLGYAGFTLGFDSNSESWEQFSSNYCSDTTYNTKYQQATQSYIKTINENASNNMLNCFERDGLHVRTIQGARPDTFYLQARFSPSGSKTKAKVEGIYVVGGTCKGPIDKGYLITSATAEQICTRSNDEAVDISITANENVKWDSPRGLSKIVKHVITPRPPINIPATNFINGTNVSIDRCVLGPGILANSPPCGPAANAAEFDFVGLPGVYRMEINYAAAASRPVKVRLNGIVIRDQAISGTTGGWSNDYLRWTEVGQVMLKPGNNKIRLERQDVFPHIQAIRFIPE